MQSSPTRFSQKKSSKLPVAKSQFTSAHHESHHPNLSHQQQPELDSSGDSRGFNSSSSYRSILHRAPYETLCHITAYLDPPSLESLSQVDRYLRKCVNDDVVWRSALFFSVLGIHPERERESPRRFLLRRLESTWKAEYITRYNVLFRWNKSRTVTTAHHPMLIPVPHIHLLQDGNSLLTAPDHFSWVFRSMPVTGKNLKGFFQPTRSHEAHPLQDWSPPSTGAISSYGGTARIAWASQLGDIMVKTAPKAMEKTAHSTATSVTSLPADRHVGIVNHVAWASSRSPINKYLTTAGSDGVVKIWDAETCAAVWTSSHSSDGTGYVKAFLDVGSQTLVALTQSGELKAWSPVRLDANSTGSDRETKVVSAWIPAEESDRQPQTALYTLILERTGPVTSTIVHAKDKMKAWRFVIRFEDQKVLVYSLCGPVGPITVLHLDSSNASEVSILMLGDSLSQVSIYDLGTETLTQNSPDFASAVIAQASQQVDPSVTFGAHEVGAVTTIASNRVLLVTGSEFGVINVWNAVTLEAVRTINASDHAKSGIGALTIVLQMDQLVASVGRSVVHWKTGKWESVKQIKTAKQKRMAQKEKGKRKDSEEYYQAIAESQAELTDAITGPRRAIVTENGQRNALRELGLDESAAVEYALMLSHDEAVRVGDLIEVNDQEIPEVPPPTDADQLNIQNIQNLQRSRGSPSTSSVSSSVREDFIPSSPWKSKSMSRVSPPNSIGKVQVSPPYRPEAMRVGPPSPSSSVPTSVSPIAHLRSKPELGVAKNFAGSSENEEFPRISPPSSGKTTRASTPPKSPTSLPAIEKNASTNIKLKVPAASQTSLNQATPKWSSIVKSSNSSASALSRPSSSSASFASITSGGNSRSFRKSQPEVPSDEEAQLQFALELSLAEARAVSYPRLPGGSAVAATFDPDMDRFD